MMYKSKIMITLHLSSNVAPVVFNKHRIAGIFFWGGGGGGKGRVKFSCFYG